MMIIAADCPKCFSPFPLGAGKFRFALPPLAVRCGHCGLLVKTTFGYRSTWTSGLIMKTVFLLSLPLSIYGFVILLEDGKSTSYAATIAACMLFFIGVVGAFIASVVLYLPAQILLEPIIRLFPQNT